VYGIFEVLLLNVVDCRSKFISRLLDNDVYTAVMKGFISNLVHNLLLPAGLRYAQPCRYCFYSEVQN